MKKTIFFMTALLAMMVFVGCEPPTEPPINDVKYSKQSYVNHDAIVDGVSDPMVNIEWLKNAQDRMDADNSRCMYCAVLQFTAVNDSVKSIYSYYDYYHYGNKEDDRKSAVTVQNLDGTLYYDFRSINSLYKGYYGISEHTMYKIKVLVDSILEYNVNQIYIQATKHTDTKDSAPEPAPYQEAVDTILNNVTDIEVLSCYKLTQIY